VAVKILHISANPKPLIESASKTVSGAFFNTLGPDNPNFEITTVDLTENIPPEFTYETYRHFWQPLFEPNYQPTSAERRAAAWALEQGKLFNSADVIVITTPMWNFSLPASVKAWIDQVIEPHLTFVPGPKGNTLLHRVKRMVLLVASGGAYPDGDPLTMQVKFAFNFIGITDIRYAWADGQNAYYFQDGAERVAKAVEKATELAAELRNEAQPNLALVETKAAKRRGYNAAN